MRIERVGPQVPAPPNVAKPGSAPSGANGPRFAAGLAGRDALEEELQGDVLDGRGRKKKGALEAIDDIAARVSLNLERRVEEKPSGERESGDRRQPNDGEDHPTSGS